MSQESTRNRGARIGAAIGVACVLGLVEWLVRAGLGISLEQGEASRALLGIVAFHGLVGLVSGLIALGGAPGRGAAIAVALPPAALLTLACIARLGQAPLSVAAALSLGWLCYRGLIHILARRPMVRQPGLWWTICGFLLTVAVALTLRRAPDATGLRIAAGALLICVPLLAWGLRSPTRAGWSGAWKQLLATTVALAACGSLGWRVPIAVPDEPVAPDQPSVLLITIDTLRADHLGAYGYTQARTPNLDALAARGILFREVVAPAVQTGPSHTSILSGLLPRNHGVLLNNMRIPESVETIADLLREEGYVTAAFVGGWTTTDQASGLPSRFQFFDDDLRPFRLFPPEAYRLALFRIYRFLRQGQRSIDTTRRGAADVTSSAIAWLERNGGRPFFVWVHLFDPHLPYEAPEQYATAADRQYSGPASGRWYNLSAKERKEIASTPSHVNHMISLYDAEIAYVDDAIGRLLEVTRHSAGGGDLLTIVTSDHGESMGEHDLFWDRDLYDPTLLVPLIVAPPENKALKPQQVRQQVQLIDVAPTILELLAIDRPGRTDGSSLVKMMAGEDSTSAPALSAIYMYPFAYAQERIAARHEDWKLIRRLPGWRTQGTWADMSQELYDLSEDPRELRDLAETAPDMVKRLEAELDGQLRPADVPIELTPAERERLRALGYVQ